MKPKVNIFRSFLLLSFTLATCGSIYSQEDRSLRIFPGIPIQTWPQLDTERFSVGRPIEPNGRLRDLRNAGTRSLPHDGTAELMQRQAQRDNNKPSDVPTGRLPTWTDTFTYQGLDFSYRMVGTDPKKGSQTTVIPTVIIPLRFIFPDGQVFDASTDLVDGQTPVHGIINSPIFQNYNFVLNGTSVGNTQYGDAFQRANFWASVSTRSPDYHVLLSQPTVLPTQTITVPAGEGSYFIDSSSGESVPFVSDDFLGEIIGPVLTSAEVTADQLPIMAWGKVIGTNYYAFHGAVVGNGDPAQTYIGTAYFPQARFGGYGADVYGLSHEIVEWLDDPFGRNFTAGWNVPFLDPVPRCDSDFVADLLETGDPVEGFIESVVPLNTSPFTYHVTEAMFIDFYTRSQRSRSVNGQYSMFTIGTLFGLPSAPSSDCIGHVEIQPQFIDVPGSRFTEAFGMNNKGSVIGIYRSSQNTRHGFLLSNGRFYDLDFPGALATAPLKINDAGTIVGDYYDGVTVHGFLFKNGRFITVDFPGSSDSAATGINSTGDIAGVYDRFQAITRGFVLHNGQFQSVDAPFGTQAEVDAINDLGDLAGVTWTDPNGPLLGFYETRAGFAQRNMPNVFLTWIYALNNTGMKGGIFENADGYTNGFVDLFGYLHEARVPGYRFNPTEIFGNSDFNQVVGTAPNYSLGKYDGFIGTLPIHTGKN